MHSISFFSFLTLVLVSVWHIPVIITLHPVHSFTPPFFFIGNFKVEPSCIFRSTLLEEIMTAVDVSRLVQDLRRSSSGYEVCGLLTGEYSPIHLFYSKFMAATLATTRAISSITVLWPRSSEAQSPTSSEGHSGVVLALSACQSAREHRRGSDSGDQANHRLGMQGNTKPGQSEVGVDGVAGI